MTLLKLIGKTRWGSKRSTLQNIISSELHLFVLIRSFAEICNFDDLDRKALRTASGILKSWLDYDTCLTAYVFQIVFSFLDPVSKKMQTFGLNILDAISSITNFREKLNEIQENLYVFVDEADVLIEKVNILLNKDSYFVANGAYCKISIPDSADERSGIKNRLVEKVHEFTENLKQSIDKKILKVFIAANL